VRDLSYELRPFGLNKMGLSQTMYQFCKDFSEKTGFQVDFQSAGIDSLNLDYDTMSNLYRLLQEGMNNVKKHADASNVQVRLVSSYPNVILRIHDDGKGFDLKERLGDTASKERMGLNIMTNRVDLLQGRIDIKSSPGKGTKIVIEVPIKDNISGKPEGGK
jgi:signal transduction histidine kinase